MGMKITDRLSYLVNIENGIIVWDIDGVLAPYEFGNDCHYLEGWDDQFSEAGDTPYDKICPIPYLQGFIRGIGPKNCWACSVSQPFEASAKAAFVTREYGIPDDHIFFVTAGEEKLDRLLTIQKIMGTDTPIAIVDDSVAVLDKIYKSGNGFKTIHVSSFLSQ